MNKPILEGVKEVGRWLALFAVSWVITTTLAQVSLVPEFATIKIWVFTYQIPVQLALNFALTFAGRFIDKWRFEKTKADPLTKTKGLLFW